MPAELRDAGGLDDLIRAVDHETRREIQREGQARRKRAQSSGGTRVRGLIILSSCLALAALGANLTLVGSLGARAPRLSAEAKGREIEKAIEFGVRRVEAHRRAKGVIPPDLAAVGLAAADGWTYQTLGAADYRLGLSFGGEHGVFDSSSGKLVFGSGKESK